MKKYLKHNIPAMMLFAATLAVTSCNDWTDVESLEMHTPTIDEVNPQLYEDYLKDLNRYKSEDHKITLVSFDNPKSAPSCQAERLTSLPDSIDYVCLNNTEVAPETLKEMEAVRAKGIRSIYMIDYGEIEENWGEMKKADPTLTEREALAYICNYVDEKLAICDQFGFDGIVIDYFGRSLVSLNEENLTIYKARQQAFFDKIMSWKDVHESKSLMFYGNAQYLVPENMNMLSKYDYIMLKTVMSTNGDDYTLQAYMALQAGMDAVGGNGENPIPADRFIVAVQLPQADDKDQVKGYWSTVDAQGEKIIAAEGAALWMGKESVDFERKGMFIMDVHKDYYNKTYGYVREVIGIMNPNK